MSAFKWRHFAGEVILWAVRWHCRYGISYRKLEDMLGERGVEVDHTTLYRWVQRYAPELEKRTAWYRSRLSFSWRVDETYVRVKGRGKYLYRAIDKDGATLDFFLADRRNAKTVPCGPAQREDGQALPRRGAQAHSGLDPAGDQHRQAKYCNNRLERDHGKLKRLIRPMLGFQSMRTARATIKGFEVMRMFRKSRLRLWIEAVASGSEVSFINRLFGLYT